MRVQHILLAWALCMFLAGCGSSNSESSPEQVSTDSDAALQSDTIAGTEVAEDASSVPGEFDEDVILSEADAAAEVMPWEPPPVAPAATPQPFPLGEWAVTFYNPNTNSAGDSIFDALEAGEFIPPKEKGIHYEQYWKMVSPGENGNFDNPGPGTLVYAAKTIVAEETTWLSVRADRVYTVWVNGDRQPGDLYGTGTHRTPMTLQPGENIVVIRGFGGAGAPSVSLTTMTHEISINPLDTTAPDLVGGEEKGQPVGLPFLNHSGVVLSPLFIRVEESEWVEEWNGTFPGIGRDTMTKIPVWLNPKGSWPEMDTTITVDIHFSAEGLEYSYVHSMELTTVNPDSPGPFRRTFISKTDGSAQFFGEMRPVDVAEGEQYALALSLHGASVDAKNQAGSYSAKDWIYHIAATNRRPFGFDWQAWGRRDALEVLDYAMENYPIDPWKVHLTGHSMGGHGTWHVGTLFAHRFATLGPSAGWINFENYGGSAPPSGPFGWNQLHFDPRSFKENLKDKGVYIIHGTADDNVPIWHGETMFEELTGVVPELFFHKEEGAGHWWDASDAPGVDCVDWAPLFSLMESREVDPLPLDFHYTAPAPWINANYSYVTYQALESPDSLGSLDSTLSGTTLSLTTSNILRMTFDTDALAAKGVEEFLVNGTSVSLAEETATWGPESIKTPDAYGPFNQVFHAPFCIAYEEGPVFEGYAAYLLANWAIIGNGSGCSMPVANLTEEIKESHRILYVGSDRGALNIPSSLPVTWGYNGVGVGNESHANSALAFVFPDNGDLAGAMVTTPGDEVLLYRLMPFTSRFVIPDYYLWSYGGGLSTGFFTPNWSL